MKINTISIKVSLIALCLLLLQTASLAAVTIPGWVYGVGSFAQNGGSVQTSVNVYDYGTYMSNGLYFNGSAGLIKSLPTAGYIQHGSRRNGVQRRDADRTRLHHQSGRDHQRQHLGACVDRRCEWRERQLGGSATDQHGCNAGSAVGDGQHLASGGQFPGEDGFLDPLAQISEVSDVDSRRAKFLVPDD